SVFVHLLDGSGAIRAQSDGPPAGGAAPTDAWSVGDRIDDRRVLVAPPGRYLARVGLYEPASGRRLLLEGGADHLDLGEVALGGQGGRGAAGDPGRAGRLPARARGRGRARPGRGAPGRTDRGLPARDDVLARPLQPPGAAHDRAAPLPEPGGRAAAARVPPR